nr:hypothetical protein [Tanacetum cinerariifolium]
MMKPDRQETNALDILKPWRKYCFRKFIMNSYYGNVATKMRSLGCDGVIDDMLRIKLREAGSNKEIFTSVAWIRGLYHVEELDEEVFDVYFHGGMCSDDHFNAQEYWSHTSTIRSPILRVVHKMITYGLYQKSTRYDKIQKNDLWLLSMFDARHQNEYENVAWLIARWVKRKRVGTQRESHICCGQFITKLAKKARVLSDEVLKSLSALIYCRDLHTTTLRELIDSEGRLIPEDPQSGVPGVGIPRPPRASMHDLYKRMGNMEIRQRAIEMMSYRQSYHWDMYAGVFEHMAGILSVPLHGAYNPLGYAQQQYDQYYWQYPPQPP